MQKRKFLTAISTALLLSSGASLAHEAAGQLGKVTFPTSCAPKVQKLFETGVAMIHSYWFGEAKKTFEAVLKDDPNCAMAHWGIALDYLGNTLAGAPPAKSAAAGWESIQKAIAIGAKTERERDWINSLAAYFRDHDKTPVNARLAAYTKATEALTEKYPDDFEVWVFHALNLQASAPKSDIQYKQQLKSAQILETLLLKSPEHPGVTHFLIHAYDYPPLADKGISAARRYAKLAPAAPHARHMPSHIYSMVGMWEESIASNLHSMAIRPDYYHAADFIVYAHLQLGQDEKAKAMVNKAREVYAKTQSTGPGALTGFHTGMAAMPARLVLERADWKGAAALPPVAMPNLLPMAESLTRFARGLGLARSGDLAGAKAELGIMQKLRATLEKTDLSYWADRTEEQMLAVSAWIALAEGNKERAEQLMRTAADNEDASVKHVAMENRLYPLRELYADLLLEMGQAQPALREFEIALKAYPNRYRNIYGIACAAEASGDRRKASEYYAKLTALAKNADTQRPELAKARTYVAQR